MIAIRPLVLCCLIPSATACAAHAETTVVPPHSPSANAESADASELSGVLVDDVFIERFGLTVLDDPRIAVEEGAEAFGAALLEVWDSACARAEAFHGVAFRKPVRGYAFATDDAFREAAVTSPIARGSARIERVFFSPKLAREWETIAGVVTHELSHALLHQHVGFGRFNFQVPRWFREGIAVVASDGAGTEGVAPETARTEILAGRRVDVARSNMQFVTVGLPLPDNARLVYLQCGMFVEFLRKLDPRGFDAFVLGLRDRHFRKSFPDTFGGAPEELWSRFEASLREP